MNGWKPVDWIVLLLAGCISTALIVIAVSPFWFGEPISDTRAKIFAHTVSTLLAVISVYVGARVREKWEGRKKNGDE